MSIKDKLEALVAQTEKNNVLVRKRAESVNDGDFPFVGAVIIDAPKKLSPEDAKAFVKKFFEENKVLLKRIADG